MRPAIVFGVVVHLVVAGWTGHWPASAQFYDRHFGVPGPGEPYHVHEVESRCPLAPGEVLVNPGR